MSVWLVVHGVCVIVTLSGTVWCSDRSSRAVFVGPLLVSMMLLTQEIAKLQP